MYINVHTTFRGIIYSGSQVIAYTRCRLRTSDKSSGLLEKIAATQSILRSLQGMVGCMFRTLCSSSQKTVDYIVCLSSQKTVDYNVKYVVFFLVCAGPLLLCRLTV